jgi:formate dehydrogenase major subunit
MTNHWNDFQNSDVILIMGSNPASNHPISFKWITKAMEKGAKLVCVDPRFTQSAAKAHLYAPLRSGTDIAFLGGMIKYILDSNLIQKEYVLNYTNASFLVNPALKMPGDNKGVFSGLMDGKYDKATWAYQTDAVAGFGLVVLDQRATSPGELASWERFGPVLVLDEGGPAREAARRLRR